MHFDPCAYQLAPFTSCMVLPRCRLFTAIRKVYEEVELLNMSTSTTTSTKSTPMISPKDMKQLKDYQEYHRLRQNSLKTTIDREAVVVLDDIDPFLTKYIKNQRISTTNSSNFSLKNSQKFNKLIKSHRKLIGSKRNRLLSIYDDRSSASSSVKSVNASPANLYASQSKDSNHHLINSLKLPKPSVAHNDFTKFVSRNFINCDTTDLIILITRMIKNLISLNNKNVPDSISKSQSNNAKDKNPLLTRYHSRTPPNIGVLNYLTRLTKFNNLSNANLLTTIYYIDLLSYNYQPFFTLNSWTVHRFLLVATMISQKSMEDYFFTNEHYAKVGGVAIPELNYLEIDFLTRVNWKCVPFKLVNGKSSIKDSKSILDMYYNQLIELMGSNCEGEETTYVFQENDFDDDDFYDDEEEQQLQQQQGMAIGDHANNPKLDEALNIAVQNRDNYAVDPSKFNAKGYSVSSSPHLKRRFPTL